MPPQQDKETTRIEAFSDGVIAIIITLLVFSLQRPSDEIVANIGLAQALLNQWPTYLAVSISFFFILVMWINHHRLFTAMRRSDNNLLLLNGLLLISVMPFVTALMATYLQDYQQEIIAMVVYSGWSLVVAVFFNLLWRYASHQNRLFSPHTDPALVVFISRQYAFGPVLYLGAMLAVLVHPFLSIVANVALAIFFALPNRAVNQLIQEQTQGADS